VAFDLEKNLGRPFGLADLLAIPDDGFRYEVLDGAIVVNAPPSRLHQRVVFRLAQLLDAAAPPDLEVVLAPAAWDIGPGQVPEPDIMVVRTDSPGLAAVEETPLLVVEVLSPSGQSRDRIEKRRIYAEAGCPSYWIVDPDGPGIEVLELDGDRYIETGRTSGGAVLGVSRPFAVELCPADLVRPRRSPG
jgi:Uma2 family endonuclease